MKLIIVIQARMGSSRLPGKMLMDINGKPTIERVVDRVKKVKNVDDVIIATTVSSADDLLIEWATKNKINYYRGSEEDVLDRYYKTALCSGADIVVRITGDCPLIDPVVIQRVIDLFKVKKLDYACNNHPPTFPDGLDVEVFSLKALKKAWEEAVLKSEREHVTPYIWKNPDKFKVYNLVGDTDLSSYRWTIDNKEDLSFLRLLITECEKRKKSSIAEIVEVLKSNAEWLIINKHHKRNEGYDSSLASDKKF